MKFDPVKFYARRTIKDIDDVNRLIYDIKIMGWPTPEQCEKFYEQIKHTHEQPLIDYYKRCVLDKQGKTNATAQSTTNAAKKKAVCIQTTTCKGYNLKFTKGTIHYGNYVMKTKQAIGVHQSIMKLVDGEYTIMLCTDKSFYFKKGELPRLLANVEKACHLFIASKLEGWINDKQEELSEYISFVRDINFTMFVEANTESYHEDEGTYDLILKNIPFKLIDRDKWKYEYEYKVSNLALVPAVYRRSYIEAYPDPLHSKEINRAFADEILHIISKTCSYTTDEYELDELHNREKRGVKVTIRNTNNLTGHIIMLPFLSCALEVEVNQRMNIGKLFRFSQEGVQAIEGAISNCDFDEYTKFDTQLDRCIKLIKGEEKNDRYFAWQYPYHGDGGINLLYDINDDRYEESHQRCDELFTDYVRARCSHILYFRDPNAHYSADTNDPFSCYLLVRDCFIILFSANRNFSTLVFKVDEEKQECGIFLIWSYFSSYMCNKREGKSFRVEYLFKHFGISPYYWRLDPISKNEDGSLNFMPYTIEEIINNRY